MTAPLTISPRQTVVRGAVDVAPTKERPIMFNAPMVRAILAGAKSVTRRVVKPQPPAGCDHVTVMPLSTEAAWRSTTQPLVCHPGAPKLWQRCPYGAPGDRLWVRETWAQMLAVDPRTGEPCTFTEKRVDRDGITRHVAYAATAPEFEWCDGDGYSTDRGEWRSPIFMPRWASRITLEVTGVRVERLNALSLEDARAEGIPQMHGEAVTQGLVTPRGAFWDREPCSIDEWDNSTSRENFARLWDRLHGAGAWDANPFVWVVAFERVTT